MSPPTSRPLVDNARFLEPQRPVVGVPATNADGTGSIGGTIVAWKMPKSKGDLLAGNGTQKG